MGAAKKLTDKKVLRDLVPLNALSAVHIEEISRKAVIEEVRAGRYVFRKDDTDAQSVYLLDGKIELIGDGREVVGTVTSGSEAARHPLAHKQPRQLSARASGPVTVARVDSSLLDVLLTWDESAGYDVVEINGEDEEGDWMTRMLQSQAFLQLPPSNIHQLLMRLEAIDVSAGDAIVRQGEDGDYFYIVKSGRLAVTRKASARSNEVALAELGEGACFGEEALVAGTKRNASVTMITNGSLMRLSKDDFNELLCAPLVHEVDFAQAQQLIAGGAHWLDVRLPGEFENQSVKGSANLPLSALRDPSAKLDNGATYILCCDTGRRSAAGAFVLSQRGFTVYILKNGLMDVPDEALTRARASAPVPANDQDAEIIPFETEGRTSAETRSGDAHGSAGSPSAAVDEAEQEAVHKQVALLRQQLGDTQTRLEEVDAQRAEEQAISERVIKKLDKLELELQQAQQERERLEAELKKAAAERRSQDKDHTAHDKQLRDLQQELTQVRTDYQQLGQRASALAGERDAVLKDLEKVRQDAGALREQLGTRQGESSSQIEALQKDIEARLREVEAEKQRRQALEQRLGEAEQAMKTSAEREQALQAQLQQAQDEAQQAVAASQAQAQGAQAELTERVEALQAQLAEQAQQLDGQQAERQALEQQLGEAEQAMKTSAEREQELQAQLAEQAQQLDGQQAEREALAQRLSEAEQSLQEMSEREKAAQEKLQQAEGGTTEIRQALEKAKGHSDQLEQQLEDLRTRHSASERKAAELETRLKDAAREHQSDVASVREALTRAQDERENIKRDQSRLMESLRKAESALERERQDREDEVYRLQKELKETAGESSAGLAAELEALQEKIKQDKQQREDLEIKLGERSGQLEDVKAQVEKLTKQLAQAQDSARQAEQQLVEANQAAEEEMTVRLQAEQEIQQGLRQELESAKAQGNDSGRQIEQLKHEADELRQNLHAVQAELAGTKGQLANSRDADRQLQAVREQLQQVELERDRARKAEQELRAEVEVSRSLGEIASQGDGDDVLREQVDRIRKDAEDAIRLRTQAEQQVGQLQQEVDRLRAQLVVQRSDDAFDVELEPVEPPPESDLYGADELQSGLDEQYEEADHGREEAVAGTSALFPEEGAVADVAVASPVAAALDRDETKGGKTGLVVGLLLLVAAAAGYWWYAQQGGLQLGNGLPGLNGDEGLSATVQDLPPQDGAEAKEMVAPAASQETSAEVPTFSGRGMPDLPRRAASQVPAETAARDGQQEPPAEAEQETAAPAAAAEAGHVADGQPGGSYRDALANGGTGPTMVEFRADSFQMGSSSLSQNFDERPRHDVDLKRFAISKYEVTFEQYDRFVKASGRSRPADRGWGRGTRPVVNVSWHDAVAYTEWLSKQTGHRYRLPSEAEWEFAARSGSVKRYWWGNEVGQSNGNCFDCGGQWAGRQTAPVGSFPASDFGVHDMAGNAREWVQDCYLPNYNDAGHDGAAVETPGCGERVVRGGSYSSPSTKLRSAARDHNEPGFRQDDLGFRVVREY